MEGILEKILSELQALHEGQVRLESIQLQQSQDIKVIRKDVLEIKSELKYVWDDIKTIDNRLSVQGEELVNVKRLK